MDLGLTGKVALIAASSKGLGRACAESLAREGAKVVINGRRPEELARAAQEIRLAVPGAGANIHTMTGDVSHPEDITRLLKATLARFGQLDILITNSGGPTPGTFAALNERDWQEALDSTLWPVVRLIRQAIPHLQAAQARGGGRIINLVSTSVKQPIPGLFLSNALRPAVIGLAKSLSVEFAADGILVNNVCPGSFDTGHVSEEAAQSVEAIPLGRLGNPHELGHLVAFLASDKAAYITGQTISIDGGLVNTLFG